MDLHDARQIAQHYVGTLTDDATLALDDAATAETAAGWVFHLAVAVPGDDDGPPLGAQPILVDGDGRVHLLSTARSVEEQVAALQADAPTEPIDDRAETARLLATHRGLEEVLAHERDPDRRAFVERVIRELEDEYRDRVPEVALSRCPFTGDVVWYPIDVDGLDGLWWRADDPVRPDAQLPATVVGVTGGVAPMDASPEAAREHPSFRVEPGPDAPAVRPDVLRHDGVIAVVSTVPIGTDVGFAVVYFADPVVRSSLPSITDWGCTPAADEAGALDADLRPWIDSGRVWWIAPFDAELELHTGAHACPYLDDT